MRTDPFTDTWLFLIGQQSDEVALGWGRWLVAAGLALPAQIVDEWARPAREARVKHEAALNQLRRLNLLVEESGAAGVGNAGKRSSG